MHFIKIRDTQYRNTFRSNGEIPTGEMSKKSPKSQLSGLHRELGAILKEIKVITDKIRDDEESGSIEVELLLDTNDILSGVVGRLEVRGHGDRQVVPDLLHSLHCYSHSRHSDGGASRYRLLGGSQALRDVAILKL